MNSNMVYQKRRQQIFKEIGNGIAVLFAAPEQVRSNDTNFPYRQNSYFYHLSGFIEPQSALILDGKTGKSILFCQPKNVEFETWNGFLYGPSAAREAFGFDLAFDIESFDEEFTEILKGANAIHALWGKNSGDDEHLLSLWEESKGGRENIQVAGSLIDLSVRLDALRLVKDGHEIDLLREAGRISALAHIQAMRTVKQAKFEYQVEAEIIHTFLKYGSRDVAYESIVAAGKNACTLHYVGNNAPLKEGELLLIDAGAEHKYYAGDITRTFPINGVFTGPQRDVYEIVLAAQLAAIEQIKPEANWKTVSDVALNVLVQGMVDLKLLKGSVSGLIESAAYKRFYMHGIGHWVGMDVHDVGGRFIDGNPILLKEGMCTTVEPGLYIKAAQDIPAEFCDIGIRIEDNVVVNKGGCEVYTADVPKSIAEIEALMK